MDTEKKTAIPELLRPSEVYELTEEANRIERTLNSSHRGALQDPAALTKAMRNVRRNLDEKAPKPYEAGEMDKMVARASTLREKIKEGMLSQEEMRRNPIGAVDKHLAWEKTNKGRIKEYKHIMLRANAGTDDRTVASIEHFRPSKAFAYTDEAQIPGHMAMSQKAKENWPLGEPKCDTAAKQAERASMSEDKKKALVERLAKARAAKAAKVAETKEI